MTVAHSRTKDLAGVVRTADLVVAAIGHPETVRGYWIKKGTILIDVGINRIEGEVKREDGTPKTKLVGDVDFKGAVGVGPMTITMLMSNTLRSAERAAVRARFVGRN